jgi:hypothetical protein
MRARLSWAFILRDALTGAPQDGVKKRDLLGTQAGNILDLVN